MKYIVKLKFIFFWKIRLIIISFFIAFIEIFITFIEIFISFIEIF